MAPALVRADPLAPGRDAAQPRPRPADRGGPRPRLSGGASPPARLASEEGAALPDPRHQLGLDAEALAARWLTATGWRILARRWRVPQGEIDLVALAPDRALVGIEVRARRSPRAGSAAETVDGRRVRRLRAALARYCAEGRPPPYSGVRVDLVTVEPVRPAADERAWRLRRTPLVDGW